MGEKGREMRIGLVSDTHGDPVAWRRAMKLLEGCGLILHAGDHLYHGAFNPVLPEYDPREMARALNECPIPILHARGNCDSEVDQAALRDPILSPYVVCLLEGVKVMLTHGDAAGEAELAEMAAGYGMHLLVRGHTHVAGIWEHGPLLVCNPGSPSLPKGDGVPTVGLLEEGKVRILDVRDGSLLAEKEIPSSQERG